MSRKLDLEKMLVDVINENFVFGIEHLSDWSKMLFGYYSGLHDAEGAFKGDLNSAKNFHKNTLPESSVFIMFSTDSSNGIVVIEKGNSRKSCDNEKILARAYLIAVLKTLIAEA